VAIVHTGVPASTTLEKGKKSIRQKIKKEKESREGSVVVRPKMQPRNSKRSSSYAVIKPVPHNNGDHERALNSQPTIRNKHGVSCKLCKFMKKSPVTGRYHLPGRQTNIPTSRQVYILSSRRCAPKSINYSIFPSFYYNVTHILSCRIGMLPLILIIGCNHISSLMLSI